MTLPNNIQTLTAANHEPAGRNPAHVEILGYFEDDSTYQAWEIAQEQAVERYLESRGEDAHLDEWDGYGTD